MATDASIGEVKERSVLRNGNFLLLWAAQAISQTAQNAIWFGVMVVVEEYTHSTTHLSIAVFSTILPGIVLGIIAGVFVDRMNKKTVLVTSNALRALSVLGYLLFDRALIVVYIVNLVFCSISQFFGPAESATIPRLVRKNQLISANSLFNLTFTGSQMAGMVLFAPWVLKIFGAQVLFFSAAMAYVIAAVLVYFIPRDEEPHKPLSALRRETLFDELWTEVKEGWSFISSDRHTMAAMRHLTLIAGLLLVMSMLVPRFVVSVLGIRAEDSVYVLAPAGVGVLAGMALMSRLAARFGKTTLVVTGLWILSASLLGMSMLQWSQSHLIPFFQTTVPILPASVGIVSIMMVLAALMGVGASLIMVPSQTILMERAPVAARGRIFAVQIMLGNIVAVLPLLFLGGMADFLGVSVVIGLVAVTVVALAIVAQRERGLSDRDTEVAVPKEQPTRIEGRDEKHGEVAVAPAGSDSRVSDTMDESTISELPMP